MDGNCLIQNPPSIGKTKLFFAFAIFYLQCKLHVLIIRLTDILAEAMAEQLSELFNDSPAFNFKLIFLIY